MAPPTIIIASWLRRPGLSSSVMIICAPTRESLTSGGATQFYVQVICNKQIKALIPVYLSFIEARHCSTKLSGDFSQDLVAWGFNKESFASGVQWHRSLDDSDPVSTQHVNCQLQQVPQKKYAAEMLLVARRPSHWLELTGLVTMRQILPYVTEDVT